MHAIAAPLGLVALSCGFYMACSIAMNLANKMLANLVALPLTVVACQMTFAVVVLGTAALSRTRCHGVVWFGSWADARRWGLTVPLLFAASLTTSHLAFNNAPIGLVMILRFAGPLFTAIYEHASGMDIIDRWILLSLTLSLGGVGLYLSAGPLFAEDCDEPPSKSTLVIPRVCDTNVTLGITYALLNLVFTMAEQIIQRQLLAINPVDASFCGLLLLNNGLALPAVAILLVATNEHHLWPARLASLQADDSAILALGFLCLSCLGGLVIGWSAINAQQHITATAMLVLSNVDKALILLGGMILLGDAHGPMNLLGIGLGSVAGTHQGGASIEGGAAATLSVLPVRRRPAKRALASS